MKSFSFILFSIPCLSLVMTSCSPRIYRPPALGAEYQFDRGMPSAKRPSHLFDKKTRKDLQEKGILEGDSHRSSGATKTASTNPLSKQTAAVSDSTKADTLTTPAAVTSPALPDSSHNDPD